MRIVPIVAAVAAALTLASCSSSSSGDPAAPPSSPAVSASQPVSSDASTPAQPSSSVESSAPTTTSTGLTSAEAKAALLTAAEVGTGFAAAAPDSSDTPLPCTPNDPPLDKQFPPNVKVEGEYDGSGGKAVLTEEIETYKDAASVAAVVAAGEKGLGCGTATLSGQKVTIHGPTDLTTAVATTVDKAEGWSVTSTGVNASLIIAQLGQHLVVFSFAADPTLKASALPDAQKIVNTALAKVDAALK